MRTIIIFITGIWISSIPLYSQEMFKAKRLTFDHAQQGFSTWSPDGKYIIYQYTDLNDTTGSNGLWRMKADGTDSKQVFSGIAEHAKWSPDGNYIVFDADTGQSIRMIPAGGSIPIRFLPDTIQIHSGGLPCWSPDATKIAFKDSGYSLCIYDMRSKITTRIFCEEGMLLLPGCWSNCGKYVLVALMEKESRKSTIWKVSIDGNEKIQIKGHHENFYRYLTLSPDGSLLIYAALEGKYLGLYVMGAEGGISLPLTVSSQGHNEGVSWSPNGKQISFTSTRSGSFDIWLMDINTGQIKKELQMMYD